MAQSLNGYISGPKGKRIIISNQEDMERVLKLRESCDGILVGSNTVINDNPELSSPQNGEYIRIVIDPDCRIDSKFRIMDDSKKTFILNSKKDQLIGKQTEYINCKRPFELKFGMEKLKERGVHRLLVEGGEYTAKKMLEVGMVDEFYLFIGNVILPEGGNKTPAPVEEIRNLILDVSIKNGGILLKIDPFRFRGIRNEK